MKIPQFSSLKSKSVPVAQTLADDLESYAAYLSASRGSSYEVSEIIAYLLQDEKRLAEISAKEPVTSKKLSLKMPMSAWDGLDGVMARTGLKAEEVIEEVSKGILRDKSFIGWRSKSAGVKAENAGDLEKVEAPKATKSARKGGSSKTTEATIN